ncbi:MAG: BACON domain-containing protein, partial [Acidimicrobiia bacterium]
GVTEARFWLDDPDRSGAPVQTEGSPPWDFAGGDAQQADPFDTNTLADGSHTITAELDLEGGGVEVVSAAFAVANDSARLSFSPASLSFTAEEGSGASAQAVELAASDGSATAFTASPDRTWVSVSPGSGSTPETLTVSVDAGGLAPGTYGGTVTAEADGYASGTLSVTLTVTERDPEPASLAFSPGSLSFTVEEGSSMSAQTSELAASDDSSVSFTASADRAWVSVSPGSGSTPAAVTVTVDASGLAPGTYGATVTAEAGGYEAGTLAVTLTVTEASTGAYELLVSSSPDRSNPVALAGETVSGDVYVFVAPEEGVAAARFWLDDPDRSGAPVQTEGSPPWDFAGGDAQQADPFDTNTVADGSHTITAELDLEGGGVEVVSAAFAVANDSARLSFSPASLSYTVEEGSSASAKTVDLAATDGSAAAFTAGADRTWVGVSPSWGSTPETLTVSVEAGGLAPGTYSATVTAEAGGYAAVTLAVTLTVTERPPDGGSYELLVSSSPNRAEPVPLAGTTVGGEIYAFLDAEDGVSEVAFYLDDPDRSGPPVQVERGAPYDFAGTESDGAAAPFDSATLVDGGHEVTALVERSDGSSDVVSAAFRVANDSPALAFSPDSLSFTVEEGSAALAQTVDLAATDGSAAAFTASADRTWVSVSPASGSTPETLTVSVDASGLAPGTHSATLTAEAGGYAAGTLAVTLTVTEATTSAYELVVSSTSDRADPVPLAGAAVDGDVDVFLSPSEGVKTVRFWLDDPDRSGPPAQRDKNPPWDFAGGSVKEAKPFDTTDVADGMHTITAELDLEGGGIEVVSATFTVAN